ncbi:TetR/AcrR family transcriptional regulator [Nonomuraea diastatica]|uniref:TetR/AcrR family transcriptional regulator n=2 Tax=Nonomuraea diastatica TaxID=1848329 RepID=A0A4R4WWB0_9ACTN|nr:TetR/AcrR family transcriptional regulator [Nonomuraea diastatica]
MVASMDTPETGEREAILRAAIRLFAALSYDATSMGQVAEAAGVDVATATRYFPTKRGLYLEVMEHAQRALAAAVEQPARDAQAGPPGRSLEALHRFVDAYIDLCAGHPEIPALWTHRWMSDASDIDHLEAHSLQPLTQQFVDGFATLAEPAEADPPLLTYTIVWCIHGFTLSGILDGTGHRIGMSDPALLARFRAHMHQLLDRVLRLPD